MKRESRTENPGNIKFKSSLKQKVIEKVNYDEGAEKERKDEDVKEIKAPKESLFKRLKNKRVKADEVAAERPKT